VRDQWRAAKDGYERKETLSGKRTIEGEVTLRKEISKVKALDAAEKVEVVPKKRPSQATAGENDGQARYHHCDQ